MWVYLWGKSDMARCRVEKNTYTIRWSNWNKKPWDSSPWAGTAKQITVVEAETFSATKLDLTYIQCTLYLVQQKGWSYFMNEMTHCIFWKMKSVRCVSSPRFSEGKFPPHIYCAYPDPQWYPFNQPLTEHMYFHLWTNRVNYFWVKRTNRVK